MDQLGWLYRGRLPCPEPLAIERDKMPYTIESLVSLELIDVAHESPNESCALVRRDIVDLG
jgi:hypothetical protein